MLRGLYTAATGALVAQTNVDVIANNLANVNTAGFKSTLMQAESQPAVALFRDQIDPGKTPGNRTDGVPVHEGIGSLGSGVRVYDTPTQFSQGALAQTGNPLDVALNGSGFFAVQDTQGNVRYTRGGSLLENAQNQLVTGDGDVVLGTTGKPIAIPAAPTGGATTPTNISIDKQGNVSANGTTIGQLAVYEFANLTAVRPEGASKFINAGATPAAATQTTVIQGAQEQSNASVVQSMVALIDNQRWFEANEKMIQTQDTELGSAIQNVGKST